MMLSKSYYDMKYARENLARKVEKKLETINQEITIRDLFLLPKYPTIPPGEFWFWASLFPDMLTTYPQRLTEHVAVLAEITNRYHQQAYCEQNEVGGYVVKSDSLNKITRLLLPEFSLYGPRPLTEAEFSAFYNEVLAIASTKTENVHMLLSSVPVINKDNKVLNICLYVECGPDPKINTFCKARASSVDLTYLGTYNFDQQSVSPIPVINGHILSESGKETKNLNVFIVTTKGGAKYIQAIDICLDGLFAQSRMLLRTDLSLEQSDLYPDKADQVLTSSSIMPKESSKITQYVAHVDPFHTIKFAKHQKVAQPSRSLDLKSLKNSKYPYFSISETESGLTLSRPIFGADLVLLAEQERKLGKAQFPFEAAIEKQNLNACKSFVDSQLLSTNFQNAKQGLKENYVELLEKINKFYLEIAKLSAPSSVDTLLRSQANKHKMQVRKIIDKSYAAFIELKTDPLALMCNFPTFLEDMKVQIQLQNNSSSKLSQVLLGKIQVLRDNFEDQNSSQLTLD